MQTMQRSALASRCVQRVFAVARPSARKQATVAAHGGQTRLNASLLPLMAVGLADPIREALTPPAEYFKTLDLPEALIHWGHPGNMLVVLLAMGGYGALYQGWQIRLSDNADIVAKAKEMHPKLAFGMFFFFALGASGGMMSLLMQDKPIFESPHVWTGLAGLGLLSLQATLPAFFAAQGKSARDAHAYLGTAILALFLVHAGLGLQLGLSI